MKVHLTALTLVLAFAVTPAVGLKPLFAQGGQTPAASKSSSLGFGLSAGAGGVDNKRLGETWDLGPIFGGRFEWNRRESSASLSVDVQPFRASQSNQPGDFRAVYILPAYALGPPGSQIGVALGLGIFDLRSEAQTESREVGFVAALSGSKRVSQSLSLELGWKRIRNVSQMKANLYTLQLVKRWRF